MQFIFDENEQFDEIVEINLYTVDQDAKEPHENQIGVEIKDTIQMQICYLVGDLIRLAKHGQVRKCMHFQSMKQRAIKVISKSMISSEQ